MEIQVCRLRGWGVASAQCPLGESAVTCHGQANHRTAHRAKSASSDRSGFFRLEVFEAGAGASVGGEGRSGTVSAALARSSRNLSNSAKQSKLRDRLGEGSLCWSLTPWFPAPHWPGCPLAGGTCTRGWGWGCGGGRGSGRRATSQTQGYPGPSQSSDQPKGSHNSGLFTYRAGEAGLGAHEWGRLLWAS